MFWHLASKIGFDRLYSTLLQASSGTRTQEFRLRAMMRLRGILSGNELEDVSSTSFFSLSEYNFSMPFYISKVTWFVIAAFYNRKFSNPLTNSQYDACTRVFSLVPLGLFCAAWLYSLSVNITYDIYVNFVLLRIKHRCWMKLDEVM